jgi:integrase
VAWIEKREGRRGITYRVGWRDPSRKLRTRTFDRSRDARAFMREIEARLTRGQYADPSAGDITLDAFWHHFMETSAPPRPSTRARYSTHAKLYILPGLGDRRIGTITVSDVKAFFGELAAKRVGAATRESVLRILHRVFEVAVDEDRVTRNPVRGVRIDKTPRRRARFLDPSEVAAIAGQTPERYRTLIYLLAYGGLRIGEASALRVGAVDLTRGIVHVRENAPEVAGRKEHGRTKSGKERHVPLPPFLRDMLARHLEAFGDPGDPGSPVFTGPEGGEIRQNGFRSRVFQPAARRAGIKPVPTVHDLRHTAASLMARAGLSMRDAQEILGHSRSTMTDRYTHLWPEELAERVARMDEMGRTVAPAGQVVEL